MIENDLKKHSGECDRFLVLGGTGKNCPKGRLLKKISINKEKEKTSQTNETSVDYIHTNNGAEVLERLKNWRKSKGRKAGIKKITNLSKPNMPRVTNNEFTDCCQTIIGEIIISTGCRHPIWVRHQTNWGYVNEKPGFNPPNTTTEDR